MRTERGERNAEPEQSHQVCQSQAKVSVFRCHIVTFRMVARSDVSVCAYLLPKISPSTMTQLMYVAVYRGMTRYKSRLPP